MFPLTTKWRATTIFKAFILNAIAAAAISAFAIAARDLTETDLIKNYFYSAYGIHDIRESVKLTFVFISTFLGAFLVYHILYLIVAFGGGQLTDKKFSNIPYY